MRTSDARSGLGRYCPQVLMIPLKARSPRVRFGIDAASCHKCYLRPGVEVKRPEVIGFLFAQIPCQKKGGQPLFP